MDAGTLLHRFGREPEAASSAPRTVGRSAVLDMPHAVAVSRDAGRQVYVADTELRQIVKYKGRTPIHGSHGLG